MAMSDEKITQVLDLYEDKAQQVLANELEEARFRSGTFELQAAHKVLDMIPKSREFLKEGRREKLMRWLGFMQGAWWAAGVYTVDELKEHNMPPGEEFKR